MTYKIVHADDRKGFVMHDVHPVVAVPREGELIQWGESIYIVEKVSHRIEATAHAMISETVVVVKDPT